MHFKILQTMTLTCYYTTVLLTGLLPKKYEDTSEL